MAFKENLLSSIIIVAFVSTVLFYKFESDTIDYDCSKLHHYEEVPSEVISECMRILKKQKHLIVT